MPGARLGGMVGFGALYVATVPGWMLSRAGVDNSWPFVVAVISTVTSASWIPAPGLPCGFRT